MSRAILIRFGLCFAAVIGASQLSEAGFLTGFIGNSETTVDDVGTSRTTADGLVNFAVYENVGGSGDWAVDLGVGAVGMPIQGLGAGANTSSTYVYFYQLVNTNPITGDDILSLLQVSRGFFDTGGYLVDSLATLVPVVFDEAVGGATGKLANPSLSGTLVGPATVGVGGVTSNAGNADTTSGNGMPGNSTATLDSTPFVTDAAAIIPDELRRLTDFYQFRFPALDVVTDPSPDQLSYSAVVFLTSSLPPTYLPHHIHDSVFTAGDVPSNVPELGTFAMSFCAIAFGLIAVANGTRKSREAE